ncbi:MAG: GNAT family N-acetyltransferase [Pacificimonas sp.]
MSDPILQLATGVDQIEPEDWNACAGDTSPFALHGFVSALEDSNSAVAATGWQPAHLTVRNAEDAPPRGILPGYVKSHSRGEFVFDQGWADAFEHAGGRYYPKLQLSFPFTPANGPRLLAQDEETAGWLVRGAEAICRQHGLSSAHATFIEADQLAAFRDAGWLIRDGEQFHWFNRGYNSFDDFLAALSSRKRKAIRRERREVAETGIEIVHLVGDEITEADWDDFWLFYQDTGARKWGSPYLTRAFFPLVTERLGDRVVLMLARHEGRNIAAALNFVGTDCLYGRYWGARVDVPFLHFELCYYQAIDWAIARGLSRVEAGAQGHHKLARGYEPVTTHSAHWIADPGLRTAIADYLEQERAVIARDVAALQTMTPFRKG